MTPVLRPAELAPWIAVDALSGGGDVLVLAPHPPRRGRWRAAVPSRRFSDLEPAGAGGGPDDGGQSHPEDRPAAIRGPLLRQLRTDEVLRRSMC